MPIFRIILEGRDGKGKFKNRGTVIRLQWAELNTNHLASSPQLFLIYFSCVSKSDNIFQSTL